MADTTPRVVILGAPGEAQQQLRNALNELGAQTLAVGDFDQLDPDSLRQQKPDVWLVSIDEGTDSGRMERWQPLFDDPAATVIFDDADVTGRLSGWDLARWARHLAAKVLGRDDVLLPPVNPAAERLPQSISGDAATASGDAPLNALNASFEAGRNRPSAEAVPSLDDVLSGRAAAVGAAPAPPAAPPQSGFSLVGEDVDLSAPRVVKKDEGAAAKFDLSGLSLEPLEAPVPEKKPDAPENARPSMPERGVIAIIAGLGGPDAVRQFLGSLPTKLATPVLLWQQLDAGKHDRLVQQMAKSTHLPVYLAQAGQAARAGEVAVMGARMGVQPDGDWVFREGSPSAAHALAPTLKHARTVLVVLSGAEVMITEFARAHKENGGTVLVQTSATCFDGAAAAVLEKQGMASGSPGNLAERAVQAVNAK
ncbi:MAG: hypothetical protein JSS44_00490 [Proteobacteria bacterium]|nr:hypothetical protein [Pseudomonadota bacterium]MBS0463535.1 hypothetical protein [Pseudomonadota bacterium]